MAEVIRYSYCKIQYTWARRYKHRWVYPDGDITLIDRDWFHVSTKGSYKLHKFLGYLKWQK